MRYAIISDIHANEAALRAVLTDAADAHAEKIVCLGDVLGYGPDPVSTLELVYRRVHVCLAGNHDDAVSGRYPTEDFSTFAAAAVARHRSALSNEAFDWLRRLPHVCEFPAIYEGADGAFACAHGDFADPKNFNYVLEPEDAMPSWLERTEQLLFVGHSHKPGIFVLGSSGQPHALAPADFVLEPGKRYLVNVGSVGYPRNGVCRSFYCIYDDCSRAVFFRSLPFDLESYREKMHGQGLDEAPWMKKREKERKVQSVDVRGAAHFAKETPKVKVVRLKPAGGKAVPAVPLAPKVAPEPPKAAPPQPLKVPIPQPLKVTIRQSPKGAAKESTVFSGGSTITPNPIETQRPPHSSSRLRPPGIAVLVLALALVVAFFSWVFKRARENERMLRSRPVENVSASPAPLYQQQTDVRPLVARPVETQQLPEGWSVTVDHPDLQKVQIGPNARRGVVAFRIVSQKLGSVRFTKTLSLMENPPKLYWTVELLSGTGWAEPKMNFTATARITFYDERGDLIGEGTKPDIKRSATNRSVKVPEGATRAMMTVECLCEGTYDLAVPYLRAEPDERSSK